MPGAGKRIIFGQAIKKARKVTDFGVKWGKGFGKWADHTRTIFFWE